MLKARLRDCMFSVSLCREMVGKSRKTAHLMEALGVSNFQQHLPEHISRKEKSTLAEMWFPVQACYLPLELGRRSHTHLLFQLHCRAMDSGS